MQLGRCHDKPIGPHPQAMYQFAFLPAQFGQVVPWLMIHREGLNILVHPETGDDVADRTTHSLWLGEKLELNVEFLRQAEPGSAIRDNADISDIEFLQMDSCE
ncbi:MAG: DOPA 4,5-dioxygenase family protein [Microcoleus sp.]